MQLDAIGFGSLNLDEIWEVSTEFLGAHGLRTGEEYVRELDWFERVYDTIRLTGKLMAAEPGGSAANMIAALNKMGFRTGFYGATGLNDAGLIRLDELGAEENLRVQQGRIPAGRCLALIDREDPAKDRCLVILPNANDLAGSEEMDREYFSQARWVHLTSFVSNRPLGAQTELVTWLPETTRVSFDPGALYSRLGMRSLHGILSRTEVLFVTEEELLTLSSQPSMPRAADAVLESGVRTIVVKMGPEGILALSKGRELHQPPIPPRRITDRTGAGDVAAAGFLAGNLLSLGLETSLELAATAASRSIEGYGRRAYPDKSFLEEFLSRRTTG